MSTDVDGRSIWANPAFRTYWAGGFVSSTGNWLQNVTASVLMFELTGSSLMVGLLQAATFTPLLALSVVGGVLSDRFDRRRIVTLTHLLSLTVSALLAAGTLTGRITPALLIAGVALIGCSHAISKPTLSALLPGLVPREDLARASSLNVLQFNLGQVIGSTLATGLLATVGPGIAFVVNSATFLGPVIALALIADRLAPTERSGQKGFAAAIEGFRFIGRQPRMKAILGSIVLANAVMESVRTLAPELAEGLTGRAEAAGLLVGATSAGAAVSVAAFGALQRRLGPSRLLMLGFALQAAGAVGIAVAPDLRVAMVLAAPIGFGFAILIPMLNAGLQELSPDRLRGRVMSAFSMAHLGVRPVWALAAGTAATTIGSAPAVALLSVGAALGLVRLRGVAAMRTVGRHVVASEPVEQEV